MLFRIQKNVITKLDTVLILSFFLFVSSDFIEIVDHILFLIQPHISLRLQMSLQLIIRFVYLQELLPWDLVIE